MEFGMKSFDLFLLCMPYTMQAWIPIVCYFVFFCVSILHQTNSLVQSYIVMTDLMATIFCHDTIPASQHVLVHFRLFLTILMR